ncbi:homoserine dehydrogenase [Puniceicoccus vermicola]|uniref:Homoserine dehydrogenase n=1 Tax=Puniceicoccus vermicola TaxID=388746 RepID=A0A7X1E6K9_9BACT|nr:homoserine dehydrogenase [Puniceicoccus vermicola]MBC2604354.1 homoserine dehydrogenase [Puniceicoccus vermicola]
MSESQEKIRIGMLGFGTVGQGVWKHLQSRGEELAMETGSEFEIAGIVVRSLDRKRDVDVPAELLTDDPTALLEDPSVSIICELAGGTTDVLKWTRKALTAGKSVVTANKALICDHGEELMELAAEHGGRLFFEASVAGGIPVIKGLREGLVVNRFDRIYGILNGTSNYILTRMEREQLSFEPVLDAARALGYVEADESLDLDGGDAAHKTVILAWLAHRKWVPTDKMLIEGIRKVTLGDMHFARELGYRIKLIASIQRLGDHGRLALAVRPTLVPLDSLMADVSEAFNAVRLEGDVAGPTVLIGKGAGQDPTASAVIADLVDAGRAYLSDTHPRSRSPRAGDASELAEMEDISQEYYIRLTVADRSGVLAEVAGAFSKCGISIATVIQRDHEGDDTASLVLATHVCSEASLRAALNILGGEESVLGDFLVCPILDPE